MHKTYYNTIFWVASVYTEQDFFFNLIISIEDFFLPKVTHPCVKVLDVT